MPTPGTSYRQFTGVVVSAGKMMKTVRVRIPGQKWDKHIRKDFPAPYHVLVSDPTQSVREGDVVTLRNGWSTSKHIRHVVTSIVAPFGPAISERPPVPTEEQRQQQLLHAQLEKDLRKAALGRLTSLWRLRKITPDEKWLGELPEHLAAAWKRAEEAGTIRTKADQGCRNCGEQDHLTRECTQPKACYHCGKVGHLSGECPEDDAPGQAQMPPINV